MKIVFGGKEAGSLVRLEQVTDTWSRRLVNTHFVFIKYLEVPVHCLLLVGGRFPGQGACTGGRAGRQRLLDMI